MFIFGDGLPSEVNCTVTAHEERGCGGSRLGVAKDKKLLTSFHKKPASNPKVHQVNPLATPEGIAFQLLKEEYLDVCRLSATVREFPFGGSPQCLGAYLKDLYVNDAIGTSGEMYLALTSGKTTNTQALLY